MRPWETLASEYALDVPWLRVRRETCRLPNGDIVDDYYLWEGPDWVSVFALTTEDTVLLVRQYRQGVRDFAWELPGGVVDQGESIVDAAQRELSEETGFSMERGELVARLDVDPPKATFSNHLVLAHGCRPAGAQRLDPTEEIEIMPLPPHELLTWVRQGRITAQTTIACIYRALDILGIWEPARP